MLFIENVSRNFIKKQALKEVNLELGKGIYGLLGENGAGKTTLMKIIATLDRPSKGRVTFYGEEIWNRKNYRMKIGYMPQDIEIYEGFTAYDYLEYMAILKGMKKREVGERIEEILSFVNLSDSKKKKIKTFSGGMRRRIGIAQAMMNDPEILILDEPTSGLDPYERIRFSNILTNMSKDKLILFSTHIVSDIEAITDKVIILSGGEIVNKGLIKEIIKELENRVKQVEITPERLKELEKIAYIVRIKNEEGKTMVRFIEKGEQEWEGETVSAVLEDYFVYIGGLKSDGIRHKKG